MVDPVFMTLLPGNSSVFSSKHSFSADSLEAIPRATPVTSSPKELFDRDFLGREDSAQIAARIDAVIAHSCDSS